MFGKKYDVLFDFRLEGGETRDGWRLYQPGDTLSGSVTITPQEDISARMISISAGWYTEGRGDRDAFTVESIDGGSGLLTAGTSHQSAFRFHLPQQPWSYNGKLINIIWAVQAQIKPERGKTAEGEARFILSPVERAYRPGTPQAVP